MARNDLPKLQKFAENLEKFFKELPEIVGNAALNNIEENFRQEGFSDKSFTPWKPRKKNNEKKRRNLLVKTGRLKNSIRFRLERRKGGTAIIVYTDVPYAKVHNEGGTINGTVKVKSHNRKIKGKTVKVGAHNRNVNTIIPQRQFMGPSQKFDEEILDYMESGLKNLK